MRLITQFYCPFCGDVAFRTPVRSELRLTSDGPTAIVRSSFDSETGRAVVVGYINSNPLFSTVHVCGGPAIGDRA